MPAPVQPLIHCETLSHSLISLQRRDENIFPKALWESGGGNWYTEQRSVNCQRPQSCINCMQELWKHGVFWILNRGRYLNDASDTKGKENHSVISTNNTPNNIYRVWLRNIIHRPGAKWKWGPWFQKKERGEKRLLRWCLFTCRDVFYSLFKAVPIGQGILTGWAGPTPMPQSRGSGPGLWVSSPPSGGKNCSVQRSR